MPLFTNPVVLSDGTSNHSFSFRSQQPDKKSVVGDYIEDAAALAAESLLIVKHDNSGSVPRHLLSRKVKIAPASNTAGTLRDITINITVMAHPEFTVSEVEPQFNIAKDALAESGFLQGFLTSKL